MRQFSLFSCLANWAALVYLVTLSSCHGKSDEGIRQPVSATSATKSNPKPLKKYPKYLPDTTAILANQNLMSLIAKVQQDYLVEYRKVSAIPPVVSAFLHQNDSLYREPFAMADYGQRYNATDVIWEELPRRQLLYLGVGTQTVMLVYNLGGEGSSRRVLLFDIHENKITDFWTGYVPNSVLNKNSIVKELLVNKDRRWGLNSNIIYF
ncbi:hypothetical protein HER32_01230 [Hymenobacter sp. BT18]|uniref:hypothetical protein n=1 Tax=Hymenobacter sp. BT18 TaxID=2835648 RepID=UPI00143EAC4F|nr:hypothetical protein [Hymenobacter sp. BT18]QIX59886.1 hypothetical protein HER32_01230 [Hymenobacter sp. BT18]